MNAYRIEFYFNGRDIGDPLIRDWPYVPRVGDNVFVPHAENAALTIHYEAIVKSVTLRADKAEVWVGKTMAEQIDAYGKKVLAKMKRA